MVVGWKAADLAGSCSSVLGGRSCPRLAGYCRSGEAVSANQDDTSRSEAPVPVEALVELEALEHLVSDEVQRQPACHQ